MKKFKGVRWKCVRVPCKNSPQPPNPPLLLSPLSLRIFHIFPHLALSRLYRFLYLPPPSTVYAISPDPQSHALRRPISRFMLLIFKFLSLSASLFRALFWLPLPPSSPRNSPSFLLSILRESPNPLLFAVRFYTRKKYPAFIGGMYKNSVQHLTTFERVIEASPKHPTLRFGP